MNLKFVIILAFIMPSIIYSQVVTVYDADNNEPLEAIIINSKGSKKLLSTDLKGQVDISIFEDSKEINFNFIGYNKLTISYDELQKNNFLVYLVSEGLETEELVVSATRWKQLRGEATVSIARISQKEVEFQNPQTAADLLGVSGKVFIQKSQQGGGSPMIRGFATNRLLYIVDGVRMNTAIFRGGNIQNVISLDPFAMQSTEVLFGPASTIYGSDAIGGVMSFQTKEAQFGTANDINFKLNTSTRYSSANNERTGHVDFNLGWEKFAFFSSFSASKYDDLRQGSTGPDDYIKPYKVERIEGQDIVTSLENSLIQTPSAYDQFNIMQKVRYKPNNSLELNYGFHYSETSSYGRYDRHNRIRNDLPQFAQWDYGPQKWMMNTISIENSDTNYLYDAVNLRFALQNFEESRIDRGFNRENRRERAEKVDAYSINLDFIKSTNDNNTLYYGMEYVINEVKSTGTQTNILTEEINKSQARYPQSDWSSLGIYISDKYKYSDKLLFQASARYNINVINANFEDFFEGLPFNNSSLTNSALTGSIGAVFRPDNNWIFSTNLSTAFRAPNIDDIGKVFDSEPGSVVIPNINLEAEYAYNIDFSIAKHFSNFMKLDVTAFYTHLSNALVRRDFSLNGQDSVVYDDILSKVQAIQNAAIAKVYGLQTGIEVKFGYGFSFTTDINFQLGEEEMDDGTISRSRHAVPLFGVSRLNYKKDKLHLQMYSQYQSEISAANMPIEEKSKTEIYALDKDGNAFAPSWNTLNFKAMYHFTKDLSITLGLENIFDIRYRPYSSGISAPGRNFIIALIAGL